MLLKRFYDDRLAHASYLVGCPASGEAAVVDPSRDPGPYLAAADEAGVKLVAVLETHIHADYLSGARELADRAAARLYLSDLGSAPGKYAFPGVRVTDGLQLELGKLRLQALATPGHTPEHVAWLLTDTAACSEPVGLFSGDLLLVGEVGRPEAAEEGARQLFRSLRKLDGLPDFLQIWPCHGSVPQSTLGYERASNGSLRLHDEEEFVRVFAGGQPDDPPYFARMKRLNQAGPPLLANRPSPPLWPARQLAPILADGALVLDLRPAGAFAARMPVGALSLPFNRHFVTWAGWLVPADTDFFLITDRPAEAQRSLASIGLDRLVGYFSPDAVEELPGLQPVPRVTADEARRGYQLLDVRWDAERAVRHIPGSLHIPLGRLPGRLEELADDSRPLAVYCQSGVRSAIAASLLHRAGFRDAADLGAMPS